MPSEFPELTYKSPLSILGTVSVARPDITLDWSVDVDTAQFSTASTRAQLVMVINETTNVVVDTEYVSYDSVQRRLILRPSSDLDRNTTYSILVDSRVLATTGRRSKIQYRWQFSTGAGTLGAVQLLEPSDYSVQSTFPTFSWTAPSTGVLNYWFQLDDRFDFVSPTYSTTTTATSIAPIAGYTDNTTYYWRIFAYTASTSGAWSEIRSFYYGTPRAAHASTQQVWNEADDFAVTRMGWTNGATNLSAWPTISLTFSSIPDSAYISDTTYLSLVKKNLMPRNDQVATYLETVVVGSWTVSGSSLIFTPGESIANNTRYEVRISKYLPNTSGVALGADYVRYFTGHYTPRYADIPEVRRLFLSAEHNIPDDMINYFLFFASLEAHARFYGGVYTTIALLGDSLKEPIVRDVSGLDSFGVGRWVAAKCVYELLRAVLFESTRQVDSHRKLGDYEYTLGPGFIKGMDLALKLAKEDVEKWDDLVTPNHISRSTSVSSGWSPFARDWDWSVGNLEAQRDNPF